MEDKIREQPEVINNAQGEESQVELGAVDNDSGSLGKFKNAEALLSAYNNLQAEFTRKCQKLSEFEKDKVTENPTENVEENTEPLTQTNAEKVSEDLPIYKQENWSKSVLEFLKNNPDAKPFAKEVCEEVMNNSALHNNSEALDLAWAKVMQKEYKSPSQISSDEFIDDIISKENVKKKVAEILAREIETKKVPRTISSHSSSTFTLTHYDPPTSMAEAKEIAKKLFNN